VEDREDPMLINTGWASRIGLVSVGGPATISMIDRIAGTDAMQALFWEF
jgi:hypothetical protein